MTLLEQIHAKAKAANKTIVLAEGTEERTLKAADIILKEGIARIILLGNEAEIKGLAAQWQLKNIDRATIIDPETNPKREYYAQMLCEIRKKKGMQMDEAMRLVADPLYLACLLIKNGDADGEVAGARNATGDVLRPAFQIVKTLPGVSVVSGAFIMILKDNTYGENGMFVFADCAATPCPTAEELGQIAVVSAQTAKAIAGFENPRRPPAWLTNSTPMCISTANSRPMPPSFPKWVPAKPPAATSQAKPTCLSSPTSRAATSAINLSSVSPVPRLWVPSCRAWPPPSTTLAVAAASRMWSTSWLSPPPRPLPKSNLFNSLMCECVNLQID